MKVASAEQTSLWFDPQIEALRKEFQKAREAFEAFQAKSNLTGGVDTESGTLANINTQLASARAGLTVLQSRLTSDNINLAADPGDPDLQTLEGLRTKVESLQTEMEAGRASLGANNPRMVQAQASVGALRKQIVDATGKMHQHLEQRIALQETEIQKLEVAQAEAQKALIAAQAQRDRLGELQQDAFVSLEQMNAREREAAQIDFQRKLTFADVAILDRAVPPTQPAFPKPAIVIPVAIGAGLALGLILALLAEMLDRRIRFPADLEFATSRPMLGVIKVSRRSSPRLAVSGT